MVTITLNPNVSTYTLGDPPITATLSGSGDVLWESNNGNFANKLASPTVFTPNNGTALTSIIGRRVFSRSAVSVSTSGGSVASSGNWSYSKSSINSAVWDVAVVSNTGIDSGDTGFFQFVAVENNTEKAGGLVSNNSYRDPTNASYEAGWHLSSNGTAVPRALGVSLSQIYAYKNGDEFRIAKESTRIAFYINGRLAASTAIPSGTLYGSTSFKTSGASLSTGTLFSDPTENQATKAISIVSSFPVQPNYTYELSIDNNTLASYAEDGTGTFRKKGNSKKILSLQFIDRPFEEYQLLVNFWNVHEKHSKFVYEDLVYNDTYLMRFDSGFRTTVQGPDRITIQVTLREA